MIKAKIEASIEYLTMHVPTGLALCLANVISQPRELAGLAPILQMRNQDTDAVRLAHGHMAGALGI